MVKFLFFLPLTSLSVTDSDLEEEHKKVDNLCKCVNSKFLPEWAVDLKLVYRGILSNQFSHHYFLTFCCTFLHNILTVLTALSAGLTNGDMSWKIQELCVNWKKTHDNFEPLL